MIWIRKLRGVIERNWKGTINVSSREVGLEKRLAINGKIGSRVRGGRGGCEENGRIKRAHDKRRKGSWPMLFRNPPFPKLTGEKNTRRGRPKESI